MHQACVFGNQAQYEKANSILSFIIKESLKKPHIGKGLYQTISQFQLQLNKKQSHLAYWARKSVTMSFNAMTTSPVESINCHIKYNSKVSAISI
jgi:hypothetical protein